LVVWELLDKRAVLLRCAGLSSFLYPVKHRSCAPVLLWRPFLRPGPIPLRTSSATGNCTSCLRAARSRWGGAL